MKYSTKDFSSDRIGAFSIPHQVSIPLPSISEEKFMTFMKEHGAMILIAGILGYVIIDALKKKA